MTTDIRELESQIERLVQQHLAACREAARAAVERAFASAPMRPKAQGSPRNPAKPRAAGQRREPAEMARLAERLYEAVSANPGETMAVLSEKVGGGARMLHRPMWHLKQAGRVRSVGDRQQTRYFPLSRE